MYGIGNTELALLLLGTSTALYSWDYSRIAEPYLAVGLN
jgi:hypothetical protein